MDEGIVFVFVVCFFFIILFGDPLERSKISKSWSRG